MQKFSEQSDKSSDNDSFNIILTHSSKSIEE